MAAGRFQRILVAVDGPEDATGTIPLVADLARAFGSEVLVAHFRERVVAAGGRIENQSIPDSMAFGEQVARQLIEEGIRASVDVRGTTPDHVGDEILAAARSFGADLIVIGPHRAHGARQRLFGDIGRTLAHHSLCPVLLMSSVEGRAEASEAPAEPSEP